MLGLRHPSNAMAVGSLRVGCPWRGKLDGPHIRRPEESSQGQRLWAERLRSSRVACAGDRRVRRAYGGARRGERACVCLRELSGGSALCQRGDDVVGVGDDVAGTGEAELGEMREERGVKFAIGKSFYREESALGRDLSVLAAALYRRRTGSVRVLDAMSGCGVRAARYLAHAHANLVWANDGFTELRPVLSHNLRAAAALAEPHEDRIGKQASGRTSGGVGEEANPTPGRWKVTHEDANRVLLGRYLAEDYFDLVDVDSFGSESWFLGSALSAVRYGGMVYATCTDGFSSGGHRPFRALAAYGAYVRPLPYGNELGLRMLIGGAVREGATRSLCVRPVFSHYSFHGPVFRCMLRVTSEGGTWQSKDYSFVGHCFACGSSRVLTWTDLGNATCGCGISKPMAVCGPLWTGPLHSHTDVAAMAELARDWSWHDSPPCGEPRSSGSSRGEDRRKLGSLLDVMLEESDERLPPWYIELDQISKIGRVPTPRKADLMEALKENGYAASRSHVEPTALKTDATMSACISISKEIAEKNAKSHSRPV